MSDSDTEIPAHLDSEKPKKSKKAKKTSKSKTKDGEEETKKSRKEKQNDDDVFISDNGEQGLNLLAKYSLGSLDGKASPKKRKRSTVSDDAPGKFLRICCKTSSGF